MPGHKLNARDLIVEVRDPDEDGSATWVEVDGLNSATINKAENEEITDTTTFTSGGAYEHEVMQRGKALTLVGFYLDDEGNRDPGQEVIERLATRVGTDSLGEIRMRYPSWDEWVVWDCTASEGESGGDNNAKTSFNATIRRSGATRSEAVESGGDE